MRDVMTVAEVAEYLQLSCNAVYDLVRSWEQSDGTAGLRSVRFGRLIRIRKADVENYLASPPPTPPAPQREPAAQRQFPRRPRRALRSASPE